MKYIKEYNNFNNDNLAMMCESIDLKLYEGKDSSMWKSVFDKVLKDTKIQFSFVATFGLAITAYIPVIKELIVNSHISISDENIVLLIIVALATLLNERRDDIQKLMTQLKNKGIFEYLDEVIKSVKSIKEVFKFLTKGVGKTINFMTDMFAYTAFLIPFLDVLHYIIAKEDITLQNMLVLGTSLLAGTLTLTIKNFLQNLYSRLKFKIESVFKMQNSQNILPIQTSTENMGPK